MPRAGRSSSASATAGASIGEVMARPGRQRSRYAHGSAFTSEPLERYAARARAAPPDGRPRDLPGRRRLRGDGDGAQDGPGLPPRAGRDGPLDRHRPVGELPRQHPRRARPVAAASRSAGRTRPGSGGSGTSAPPTRIAPASRARTRSATAEELAAELDRSIDAAGPGHRRGLRRRAHRRRHAGAVSPPDGYWQAIAEVCRRHGVLLIADEVMTGFGRTGRWFGIDHWGVRPDILVAAKGATSGYWPFGFVGRLGRGPRRDRRGRRLRPRLHVLPPRRRGRRRRRGPADPRGRGASSRRAPRRASGCGPARRRAGGPSERRRDPRTRPARRPRARRATGRPARRSRGARRSPSGSSATARADGLLLYPRHRAADGTTATSSSSGRRSWSPMTSSRRSSSASTRRSTTVTATAAAGVPA